MYAVHVEFTTCLYFTAFVADILLFVLNAVNQNKSIYV